MEPPRPEEVASRLRLSVMRLARRLRQESEGALTPSMLAVLSSIERAQPVTLGALATIERVQPPTITAAVGRLEEKGLVRREADPADRRVARVSLTAAGERLVRRNRTRRDAFLALRLRRLAADELATLERAAEILERLVGETR
jgi:DNA-binding MarR family transcriptional regulator